MTHGSPFQYADRLLRGKAVRLDVQLVGHAPLEA